MENRIRKSSILSVDVPEKQTRDHSKGEKMSEAVLHFVKDMTLQI